MRHLTYPALNFNRLGYVDKPSISGNPGKDSLVGWWSMDEASGNALDSHINGLTLTDINTVARAAAIKGNGGVFVNANQEYFTRANEAALQAGAVSITIGGWFQTSATFTLTPYLMSKDTNSGNGREFAVHRQGAGNLRFIRNTAGPAVDSTGGLGDGVWQFFVAWHDVVAATIHIQLNNGTIFTTSGVIAPTGGTGPFQIGARTTGSARYGAGMADEIFYYKGRVLTAAERTWLYNAGIGRTYSELA